ncbi:MAG TPA: ATP-dependent DNA ligase, partial [Acidimicrobiia bacterium]
EQALADASPPVHITPITADEGQAQRWFEVFEGAGLDGVVAKHREHGYQPGRRVMNKVKHDRTADCVVVGYRAHKSGPDVVGSLLIGLYADSEASGVGGEDVFGALHPIGVVASFTDSRRRELAEELKPLVIEMSEHPWGEALIEISSARGPYPGSRWNPGKDLSFVPLRPERVVEVRYNHMDGRHLRHPAQFVRWRPDRDPTSCGFGQLEQPAPLPIVDILDQGRS